MTEVFHGSKVKNIQSLEAFGLYGNNGSLDGIGINLTDSFDLAKIYSVEEAPNQNGTDCHRRIQLGPLNGTVYFRYWDMDQPLSFYVNNANDEIDRHKGKARDVKDELILRPKDDVYGILFELEGDVATEWHSTCPG